MTRVQYARLGSAALGAIGTIVSFVNSYADQPLEGGVLGSDALTESNNRIRVKNHRRHKWQKVGLVFLGLSFFFSVAAGDTIASLKRGGGEEGGVEDATPQSV